jgi:aminoglycoside phosphotransferase (APT) family kinase protein
VKPLPHSYTNDTRSDSEVVVKRFEGPDAAIRRRREYTVLDRLKGRLPVPRLRDSDDGTVCMEFVAGMHGQELIEAGHAAPVLRACGEMLRRVHDIDVADVLPEVPPEIDAVLVHGDYGPNNMLFDPRAVTVTAVLDWEWAHPGDPIEDLAWCEWIVRMHHRDAVDALSELFDGYGWRPAWAQRQQAMLTRCQSLLDMCRRSTPEGVRLWQRRLSATAAWSE